MYQIALQKIVSELGYSYQGGQDTLVQDVVIDSRKVRQGSLFVAIKGEHTDGHLYIDKAIANGAVAIVCAELPENLKEDVLYIIAEGESFVQTLAKWMRQNFKGQVIAITGSQGKTSTKDLLAQVMGSRYRTIVTPENLNNELGLPLTITQLKDDTEVLIVEMGMSGLGEIDFLCQIAQPNHGLITSIGQVHAELLGSQEKIAQAKCELLAHLGEKSFFGYRLKDSSFIAPYLKNYPGKAYTAGIEDGADVQGLAVSLGVEGSTFQCQIGQETATMHLPFAGQHYVENALLVIGMAHALGLSLEAIKTALSQVKKLSSKRMEEHHFLQGGLLINDAYNANPASMKATLEVLKLYQERQRIAVLGDMYELGPYEKNGHYEVGQKCFETGVSELITVGHLGAIIASGARDAGMDAAHIHTADTVEEAAAMIRECLQPDGVVLLKASRSVKMEKICQFLEDILIKNGDEK